VSALATGCAARGAALVLISTNEVFDGARSDGRGYRESDPTNPINAYGTSKLAGETAAGEAFGRHPERLWVVRTAWLFGPPGNDFPAKILAAADRLEPGASLPVVADEVGSPTHTGDLAGAIIDLLGVAPAGTYHLAGDGNASRLELAQAVLDACRPGVTTQPISRHHFARRSTPPAWAVLDCGLAASYGVTIRDWRPALAAYAREHLRPMALGMAR
jgi:dTDP-4-dehydrorhamnose reductase